MKNLFPILLSVVLSTSSYATLEYEGLDQSNQGSVTIESQFSYLSNPITEARFSKNKKKEFKNFANAKKISDQISPQDFLKYSNSSEIAWILAILAEMEAKPTRVDDATKDSLQDYQKNLEKLRKNVSGKDLAELSLQKVVDLRTKGIFDKQSDDGDTLLVGFFMKKMQPLHTYPMSSKIWNTIIRNVGYAMTLEISDKEYAQGQHSKDMQIGLQVGDWWKQVGGGNLNPHVYVPGSESRITFRSIAGEKVEDQKPHSGLKRYRDAFPFGQAVISYLALIQKDLAIVARVLELYSDRQFMANLDSIDLESVPMDMERAFYEKTGFVLKALKNRQNDPDAFKQILWSGLVHGGSENLETQTKELKNLIALIAWNHYNKDKDPEESKFLSSQDVEVVESKPSEKREISANTREIQDKLYLEDTRRILFKEGAPSAKLQAGAELMDEYADPVRKTSKEIEVNVVGSYLDGDGETLAYLVQSVDNPKKTYLVNASDDGLAMNGELSPLASEEVEENGVSLAQKWIDDGGSLNFNEEDYSSTDEVEESVESRWAEINQDMETLDADIQAAKGKEIQTASIRKCGFKQLWGWAPWAWGCQRNKNQVRPNAN